MFGKLAANARGKLLFGIFATIVQIFFLVLFFVFGEYDEFSSARGTSTPPDSRENIQEYYPSKNFEVHVIECSIRIF